MSKPIQHRVYELGDRTFSIHSSFIPAGAVLVDKGWTVEHPDGTSGLGRAPFATQAEAQAWCDAHPNFPGMSQG
jgi:hypothetical protein